MKLKTKSENEWVRFLGFTNSSRSHRANERIFHFDKSQSVWVCQCDKVTFFHCARYYRNVPISAQSKPGLRVGGWREGENISDFHDLILEYQCSSDYTVPLYLCTELPLKHWDVRERYIPTTEWYYRVLRRNNILSLLNVTMLNRGGGQCGLARPPRDTSASANH